ncbi:uncharacterized protein EI97DRAFT_379665 [Westerdykella ornata]|uniref:BTB domain-containing protein n=1 Tax=Westerdykella ornata TaxID=318751 RepID=A0A6A6JGA4_WESOR|nr:uncharacterized protein EI97DRAFT_379665 [Westerdykella ornata]KAF2275244.1 hypothetical protein EI97DRAFT_379665 [Westerdykella ornata]
MEITGHHIDIQADTVIILKNPPKNFAVWRERTEDNGSQMGESTDSNSENQSAETEDLEEGEVHYFVSSRHLSLASRVFSNSLNDPRWKQEKEPDGLYYISASGWCADAFLILMNIFHLQNQAVPKTVDLEMMAKIAVLVDFYECERAVEWHTSCWLTALRTDHPPPATYCRELILWMCVSRVFGVSSLFKNITRVAIRDADEPLQTLGLPLDQGAPDKNYICQINRRRLSIIDRIVNGLFHELDTFRSPEYVCPQGASFSFVCGASVLGALTKHLASTPGVGGLDDCPLPPFWGLSWEYLRKQLSSYKSLDRYSQPRQSSYDHSYDSYHFGRKPSRDPSVHSNTDRCDLHNRMQELMDSVKADTEGLELKQAYTRVPEKYWS